MVPARGPDATSPMDPTITITFLVYLAVVMGIGVIAYRRTQSLADYILGGRRLGSWTTALSAQASDMSGWLLLGLPGAAYAAGLETAAWIALGLLIGTYLNWRFVARRLRLATERLGNALTIPDYFEARFADNWRVLRIFAALFVLVFLAVYTSAHLVAGAKLFHMVFDVSHFTAVTAGAIVILVYTALGGFLAVSWTDALQGTLMFLALLVVVALGVAAVGGVGESVSRINAINPALLNPLTDSDRDALGVIAIASGLGWGLGYFGQPHILVRFMAIRDPEHLKRARWIAMTWVTTCLCAAVAVGLVGIAHLGAPGAEADTETVFIQLTELLLHPVIAGVCLAGILAAVMSTADSQLLVASSAVSEDLYKALLRPRASQRELVWVGRAVVVALALGAYILAQDEESGVLELVGYAWAGFGATFGPTILMSVLWPRMNRAGALAGVVTGGAAVIVWDLLAAMDGVTLGGLFALYELVPAFALSLLAIVVVTWLTGGRDARDTDSADNAPADA